MRKSSILMGALLVLGLLVTSAFSMPLSVRNGLVSDYAAGKTLTVRATDHTDVTYNLTSNTKILPSSMASDLKTGAHVTVFAQCFHTSKTSGCVALAILVRQAASSKTQTTSPAATPQPTPTP